MPSRYVTIEEHLPSITLLASRLFTTLGKQANRGYETCKS